MVWQYIRTKSQIRESSKTLTKQQFQHFILLIYAFSNYTEVDTEFWREWLVLEAQLNKN